jgi:hypothetical protein
MTPKPTPATVCRSSNAPSGPGCSRGSSGPVPVTVPYTARCSVGPRDPCTKRHSGPEQAQEEDDLGDASRRSEVVEQHIMSAAHLGSSSLLQELTPTSNVAATSTDPMRAMALRWVFDVTGPDRPAGRARAPATDTSASTFGVRRGFGWRADARCQPEVVGPCFSIIAHASSMRWFARSCNARAAASSSPTWGDDGSDEFRRERPSPDSDRSPALRWTTMSQWSSSSRVSNVSFHVCGWSASICRLWTAPLTPGQGRMSSFHAGGGERGDEAMPGQRRSAGRGVTDWRGA